MSLVLREQHVGPVTLLELGERLTRERARDNRWRYAQFLPTPHLSRRRAVVGWSSFPLRLWAR